MKFFIKIIDPEHSELIQNKLFELGFLWQKEPRNVIRNKNTKYIFIPTVGFSLSYSDQVFPFYTEYKQITYLDLFTINFLSKINNRKL